MTDEDRREIYVLKVNGRRGNASENGCTTMIEYIEDSQPGVEREWLDEFIERETEHVTWGKA